MAELGLFQLWSFYWESIGIADGFSIKKGFGEMSVSKLLSGSSCMEDVLERASMTLGQSRVSGCHQVPRVEA